MIDNLLYVKLPPHLKRSLNLSYLEKGTYDQIVAHLEKSENSVVWKLMWKWPYPQWQPYPQMIFNETLNKLKSYAIIVKNQATLLEIVVKGWKRNRSKEKFLQHKTQGLRHPDHLYPVLIANKQTILPKNAGAAPMPLIDPNGSNKIIQQTIEMLGKNKKIWPIQDPYRFLKALQTRKTRLQWADYTSLRQNVISDPPTIV